VDLLTLGSFAFFTALVGVLTWRITRRDRHDTNDAYFLAGRSLTGGYIAGSLMLTNLSTEQLVGLNGAAFADGLCVMAWEVIAGASLVVMALFFLPRYLKSGIATVPQFLEKRFDHHTRTITSIIFIIAYALILLPIILYTGATGLIGILDFSTITGIQNDTTNLWIAVWLIGIIGSIYAIFGGLRTVAVSDTLNGFGLLVGGFLILWFGLSQIGAGNPLDGLTTLREAHPEKFNSIGPPESSVPFSTLFTGVLLLNLFYWCTNQQIIQRTFGASTLKEGQKGVLMAGWLKVLAPLILVLPGIIAFHMFGRVQIDGEMVALTDYTTEPIAVLADVDGQPQLIHGDKAIAIVQTKDVEEARSLVGQTRDVSGSDYVIRDIIEQDVAVVTDTDGQLQFRRDAVLPPGVEGASLVAPRYKDKAYGRLVRTVLPSPLAGFFAAVMIGAILSSFNSALNSTATLFSLGVYKDLLHPTASDAHVIRAGKVVGALVAVAAMLGAPMLEGQDSIFGYLQKMNGLYFIPIFSVVLIGMLTRRVSSGPANAALILGFCAIAIGYFVPAVNAFIGPGEGQLHEFHFLGVVFAALIALMLISGRIAPRKTPWVHEYSGDVDLTPWPLAKPIGLALVAFVLAVYVYFADFSVLSR
jgi:solute:Na+ symporter, SSS family